MVLSKERFQFIFKYVQDLDKVLKKGVQTFNQWAVVMERWVEKTPPDYLQHIKVWVQIHNIPINHYTVPTITTLGEFACQVKEVAYDLEKPQNKEYVRVKVRFDVSKPVRRSKVVNLPYGEVASILYDYERLQKRCYTCQRLSHEQSKCPFFIQMNQAKGSEAKMDRQLG